MLIYQRYIILSTFASVGIVTFVVTGLVWVTQVLKLLHLVNSGARLTEFFKLVLLILPSLFFIVLPFSTAIASIYVYNRLYEERQLIILKNTGLSNFQLAKPALIVAAIITLLSYYISVDLLPNSYIKLKESLGNIRNNFASSVINERTFSQIAKSLTIYVDKKQADGTLKGIVLFDNRNEKSLSILFADYGRLWIEDNNPFLELKHGNRQSYDENGNMTRLYFNSSKVELLSKKPSVRNKKNELNEYYIEELFNPDDEFPLEKRSKLISEGHQRLVWPLFSFVLTFLGLAVFLRQPYNKKSTIRPIVAATVFLVLVVYAHFTLQNLISRNSFLIVPYYANFAIANLVAIWFYRQRRL